MQESSGVAVLMHIRIPWSTLKSTGALAPPLLILIHLLVDGPECWYLKTKFALCDSNMQLRLGTNTPQTLMCT